MPTRPVPPLLRMHARTAFARPVTTLPSRRLRRYWRGRGPRPPVYDCVRAPKPPLTWLRPPGSGCSHLRDSPPRESQTPFDRHQNPDSNAYQGTDASPTVGSGKVMGCHIPVRRTRRSEMPVAHWPIHRGPGFPVCGKAIRFDRDHSHTDKWHCRGHRCCHDFAA